MATNFNDPDNYR